MTSAPRALVMEAKNRSLVLENTNFRFFFFEKILDF